MCFGIVFVSASAAEEKKYSNKSDFREKGLIWLRIPGHSPQQGRQGDENLKQPVTSHYSSRVKSDTWKLRLS